ncbi:MAG TPA: iron ABC transporter permease [Bacteroidales bacterium]|nr:iron ABC transporter permease [Bacteroidales bacterium]
MKSFHLSIKFIIIIIILICLLYLDFITGFVKIPFNEILKYFFNPSAVSEEYYILIKEFRLPRVVVALIAGASLSVSGLLMQTIFRNPLAGPYVLGVSSGASLGVALVVMGGSGIALKAGLNPGSHVVLLLSAGLGSALVLSIILAISSRVRDILSVLITGILIAGVVSSVVSILQYFATDINVKSFVVWTMGSLHSVSFSDITVLFPLVLLTTIFIYIFSKKLNLLLGGENFAISMGVKFKSLRIISFITVSILTGAITAYCGPIGFIGIAVPHIARWIFNTSDHFVLIPASIIIGGIFILGGDIISCSFTENGILPINAITAILGAPFIIWVVIKNKRTMV